MVKLFKCKSSAYTSPFIFAMSFSGFIKGKRACFKNQVLGNVGKMVYAKLKLTQLIREPTVIFWRLKGIEGMSADCVQSITKI